MRKKSHKATLKLVYKLTGRGHKTLKNYKLVEKISGLTSWYRKLIWRVWLFSVYCQLVNEEHKIDKKTHRVKVCVVMISGDFNIYSCSILPIFFFNKIITEEGLWASLWLSLYGMQPLLLLCVTLTIPVDEYICQVHLRVMPSNWYYSWPVGTDSSCT